MRRIICKYERRVEKGTSRGAKILSSLIGRLSLDGVVSPSQRTNDCALRAFHVVPRGEATNGVQRVALKARSFAVEASRRMNVSRDIAKSNTFEPSESNVTGRNEYVCFAQLTHEKNNEVKSSKS